MARFDYVKTRREDVREIPVRYEKLVRLGAKLYMKRSDRGWRCPSNTEALQGHEDARLVRVHTRRWPDEGTESVDFGGTRPQSAGAPLPVSLTKRTAASPPLWGGRRRSGQTA